MLKTAIQAAKRNGGTNVPFLMETFKIDKQTALSLHLQVIEAIDRNNTHKIWVQDGVHLIQNN